MTRLGMIAVLLVTVCLGFFCSPAWSENADVLSYTVQFSLDDFSFDKIAGYDVIRLNEAGCLADLGKPMLPSKQIRIALPPGVEATDVQVSNFTHTEVPGEFLIFPSQPPIELGVSGPDEDLVEPDAQVYQSDRPYPAQVARLVGQTDLAGQAMAVIQLFPLQYVPAEKRLVLYTSITLTIQGVGGYRCGDYLSPNVSPNGRIAVERMVEHMVVNPGDVRLVAAPASKSTESLPDGSFDHVVVTSSSYASSFQPIVDWHNQRGLRDTIVTTTWIYANYAGADTQKIRQFVVDASTTWGTTYFLLGGETNVVPFAYRYYYEVSASSDQYYSDFDDDWTNEVVVGRATVGSTTEINTFVNKLLKYEKDPPRTDYPLKALFIGMDLDDYTHAEYLKNFIDSYYLPSNFALTTVYDSHTGSHKTAVIDALNSGCHLVNHADHCYIQYLGTGDYNHHLGLSNSDVDALTNNGELSIVVSLGCHPNHMDASDCIAEHFVVYNPNQGAVAFVGNTRSGWGYVGNPYSLSGALERDWWKGLFEEEMYNPGLAMTYSKHQFSIANPDADMKKHCEWNFNLLGEPEMPIWTDEPDSFAVSCPSSLPEGKMPFTVHVEDSTSHLLVDSAYVCLWKPDEIYLAGYTDADGNVSFDPVPATTGNMYVTVTKHNYLPHQREVEVTFVCGDFNVAGGDGVVDLGDVVYLINYLFKSGPAPMPLEAAEVNLDQVVDVGDVVYLVNYLYKGGTPPCAPE